MRPIPIPDGLAEAVGGRRVIIGEPDPTDPLVRPCEYVVTESVIYPGRPCVSALVELEDVEREAIAHGARLWMRMDGGELPWSIEVEGGGM